MKLNKNVLIVLGMGVATVLIFLLIQSVFPSGNDATRSEVTVESLNKEILELESNILELELVFKEQDVELQEKTRLLEEKYVQLDYMAKKIEELKREGRADDATIAKLENKLKTLRSRLVDEYQDQMTALVSDNDHLGDVVDSLYNLVQRKDSMYVALAMNAEEYQARYEDCAEGKGGMASAQTRDAGETVAEPVASGTAVFKAFDFRFTNVNKRGKESRLESKSIDTKKLDKLKINFQLSGNEFVDNGKRAVYVVLRNINRDDPYFNEKSGSRTFTYNGKTMKCTGVAYAEYEGEPLNVTIAFEPAEGDPFRIGPHSLTIYCEDQVIGNKLIIFN